MSTSRMGGQRVVARSTIASRARIRPSQRKATFELEIGHSLPFPPSSSSSSSSLSNFGVASNAGYCPLNPITSTSTILDRGSPPDLPVSLHEVFVAGQFFQPHRAARVQSIGANPDLSPKTELTAVVESG